MGTFAVTEIEMTPGGFKHEHIAKLYGPGWDGGLGLCSATVAEMIGYIRNGHYFYVDGPYGRVYLQAVDAHPRPYVRTHANGTPTDNLLRLPRRVS